MTKKDRAGAPHVMRWKLKATIERTKIKHLKQMYKNKAYDAHVDGFLLKFSCISNVNTIFESSRDRFLVRITLVRTKSEPVIHKPKTKWFSNLSEESQNQKSSFF